MCPVKLNRRKTIGGFGASSRPSEMKYIFYNLISLFRLKIQNYRLLFFP